MCRHPILNEGLIQVVNEYDGTRYYSPSSNQVNLQNSGPYKFQDPRLYYTLWNHQASVGGDGNGVAVDAGVVQGMDSGG